MERKQHIIMGLVMVVRLGIACMEGNDGLLAVVLSGLFSFPECVKILLDRRVMSKRANEDGTLEVLWNLGLYHAMVCDTKERRMSMMEVMEVMEGFTSLSTKEY
jgi:hypothetical protein